MLEVIFSSKSLFLPFRNNIETLRDALKLAMLIHREMHNSHLSKSVSIGSFCFYTAYLECIECVSKLNGELGIYSLGPMVEINGKSRGARNG
jgi:hypothetical protein